MTPAIKNQNPNTVLGRVINRKDRPLANLKVAVYDVDMREWQLLAETFTGREGKYEVQWTHDQLRGRDKRTADIAIKVFSKEKETEIYRSSMEEIRFNASEREEINITVIQDIPAEVIEFDFLVKEVSYLSDKVAISDLQESDRHRDVTFLSKELEVPADKIEHLVVAHRLSNLSKIDGAFFYALFRKNTLLRSDFTKDLNARLSIGIGVDDLGLLYATTLADGQKIETDIKAAVEGMIVSPAEAKNVSRHLKTLSQYRKEAEEYYKKEHPQKTIELISDILTQGKLPEIQKLFQENKNDLDGFFKKVTDPAFYDTGKKGKGRKKDSVTDRLLGFGSEVIPLIARSKGIKETKDIRKLAKLNKTDWVTEIKKVKPSIKDKKLIDTYASAIVRKMEIEFPTIAFAAQLERAKKPVFTNQDKIVSFFNKHEDFDLMDHNVDMYLKDKKVTKKNRDAINEELKSIQRIFKLVPHYSKTLGLLHERIHSSQGIVAIGETRFVNEVALRAGIGKKEAKKIYRKAETKHTAAMLMIGSLQDTMSVMDIASFETSGLAKKLEAVSKDFPNLKSLFKLTDTCECEHCRSVYSPAAYLVEILQFLDKRMVVANNAKSVLFARRPELGDIDLGCANANTPVKYIDLVCEILEEAVAPDPGIIYTGDLAGGTDPLQGKISGNLLNTLTAAGLKVSAEALIFETESSTTKPHYLRDKALVCKIENTGGNNYKIFRLRQTFGTAAELDAAPEYINEAAYTELKTQKFAFQLPFDLHHTEALAYINRFDVDRPDLMKSFQNAAGPSDANIAAERLGLTDAERTIITQPPAPNDNAAQQAFWNVPAPGNVVDYLKRVDHFMDKAGLTFKETEVLLKLQFIDKNGNLFIKHNDLSCDTEKKEIKNLDLDALDRIHRFLRLQKKTGWKFETLDEIISQANLGGGNLNDNCLTRAARMKEISKKSHIKLDELVGCFGEIPHKILQEVGPKPLYHLIFLNKAKNGILDDGLLPQKIDGSQLLTTYRGYIATCLGMKQNELELITPLLPDGNLTFSNLSFLYTASRLVKHFKLTAEDLAIMQLLSGIDFSSNPDNLLEFIEFIKAFKHSPIKATEVRFILSHEATNLNFWEIKPEKIEKLLGELKEGYKGIDTIEQSKFDANLTGEEQIPILTGVLSGLGGVVEEDVKTIIKFVDTDWADVTDSTGAKAFIDDKFDVDIDRTDINAAIDALDGAPAGSDISDEQKGLVKALLDGIAHFQIQKSKLSFLGQTVATGFKMDVEIAAIVLKYAMLRQSAPGTDSISTLLTDNLDNVITPVNYPKQYASIRLLHKIFTLLDGFEMDSTAIDWYLRNNSNPNLTWFELDTIPYEAGQTKVSIDQYLDFCRLVSYSTELTAAVNPLDAEKPVSFFSLAETIMLGAAAKRDEFLHNLAVLTGYEKDDLDTIDAHLFSAFDILNYNDPKNWEKVFDCAALVRKLGATVAQIGSFSQPVLTSAEVNDLRSTLKSRYDEDTWLATLKEVMDAVRPEKRDALVVYLLATNPDVKDENDLYEYFLIDVEMEACMPSSRIVLAHNSIQLFVQRCLMGLEPDAIADVKNDPNWNQWVWMKNYRVWEANRKVFLYPENWYDVTLTDDKTYLLSEFINEVQQNELTNDTAEEALKKYLEKLDNIAFLEVVATWYDVPTRDMHVFARTKGGDPAIYYYRRFENERYWSPWEKVELDITGDHLLAFKRNDRLCLAWPIFSEEADPNQGSKLPDQSNTTEQPIDKPRKKLKIQLATSEYTNRKWQPKRISHDSIHTPSTYSYEDLFFKKARYNLIYFEMLDQVFLFSSFWREEEYHYINGVFDIAGCKGYPELVFEGDKSFPDFYPDFKEAELQSQRYHEITNILPDDLSVRNGMSPSDFYEILGSTPGKYRISYPQQFTTIDLIALFYQIFLLIIHQGKNKDRQRLYKIPLGTLLPYFEEDSDHAYVIIPGFYKKVRDGGEFVETYALNDSEKRTASDAFQLIDDIKNWYKKILSDFEKDPPPDVVTALQIILSDPDFQTILKELSHYANLDMLFNWLIGVSEDPEVDEFLKELIAGESLEYGEQFKNMYHPLICALRSILYKDGVPALMQRETQLQKTGFDFKSYYNPNPQVVPQTFIKNPDGTKSLTYPIEDIDFTSDGSYSVYNWDLFYRLPLHNAVSLTANQRFEEALTWYHYMFNPTGALPGTGAQKYWVTKPFYMNQETDYISQRIDSLMYGVADLSNPNIKELEFAISEWRNKPFRPDVVMRFRPIAYQKALLMKYIDNLTEWGDYLFRQDTMESIAQATQMYILADKLLGPKPKIIPSVVNQPYETYNQIEARLDSFSNTMIEMENILPDLSVLPEGGAELPAPPVTLSMIYFCIPANEKMFEYWDRVADRLFKIRHCQNIDGVERSLALFAPPIDPGMLVRAAASGLDLSSILTGLNAPTPLYRFQVLSQKATELAQELRGLGNSLLQALEKKDAESMSLLRNELELKVHNAVKDIKILQIDESKEQIVVLNRTRKVTEERQSYYSSIEKISSKEQLNLDKLGEANEYQFESQVVRTVAGALRLIPEFHVGASGFGGSPHVVLQLGGSAMSTATSIGADILNILSSIASYEASSASILGGYDRRFDDWKLQERLATKELDSIDKQIAAAEIRKEIAETDLKNHELQIENAQKTDEFMRSKFTNRELYDWMIGQISSVYFRSYQLAHDFAKKAERCYRFELGNDDTFISYGYWDSMKKGLQSADHLIHDIKRMETSYLDKNKREYEITKHVSLALLDPLALVRLRASGVCDFEIPEVLYDMDHAGQYFRRIKSVSISLPCIAGPYTSVSAKLSLVNNRYRKNTNDPDNYAEDVVAGDDRFVYNVGSIQSIATSSAQNDSGVFELNFRDERYLPFENTGAISSWRLELPSEIRQFNYNTISDMVVHVKYTAREGGSGLKSAANASLSSQLAARKQDLSQTGMHIAINMKHDMPNEWHLLKKDGTIDMIIDQSRLPYIVQTFDTTEIEKVLFVAKVKDNPATFTVNVDGNGTDLVRVDDLKLCTGINSDIDLDSLFALSVSNANKVKLEEMILVVKFKF